MTSLLPRPGASRLRRQLGVGLAAVALVAAAGAGVSLRPTAAPGQVARTLTEHAATPTNVSRAQSAASASSAVSGQAAKVGSGAQYADSHYCDGCTPPLLYDPHAPVVNTTGAGGLTITPIYWAPAGVTPFPTKFQTILNGYLRNVAAASGTTSNVYSIMSEYYSTSSAGAKTYLRYKITAGTPIIDTNPLPPADPSCVITYSAYKHCVTDAQIRTELTSLKASRGLKTDLANFYPVFTAPGVESYDLDGTNSDSAYCGYHRSFGSGTSYIDYGNEPYEDQGGCDAGESPNNLLVADASVSTLSHEISEAMTDPSSFRAWNASSGHEIGDMCSGYFGPALGFTGPGYTAYNQVINGGHYYTQTEFSNTSYDTFGVGNGCVPSEVAATRTRAQYHALAASTTPAVGSVTNDAFPNTLPADGTSTSDLDIAVSTPEGFAVAGDQISYTTYAVRGTGSCGTLSARRALTDSGGHAHVTYTASATDVLCAVVGSEVDGGQSSSGLIYQGTFQGEAVQASDTYPHSLTLGTRSTFSVAFQNPSSTPALHSRIKVGIFPGDGATDNVNAGQVRLSFSTTGENGQYHPVALEGSTVNEGEIQAWVLPQLGVTLKAHQTLTVFFHLTLGTRVKTGGGGAGIAIETYLDQINPASGAISTFADTLAQEVAVTR